MVRPSGPGAVEEPAAAMASTMLSDVSGWKSGSRGCAVRILRLIEREALLLGGQGPVNCLQNLVAMAGLAVTVWFPKLIY